MGTQDDDDPPARLHVGRHEEIVINHRYEAMSIANDILIAVFFVAGSIMFYVESLKALATTMFLLGSIDLLLRPVIRLVRRTHLRRLGHGTRDDANYDY